MKMTRILVVVAAMTVVIALASFCPLLTGSAFAETKTLKIGLVSSLSGPWAAGIKSQVVAAKPAADFMNQRGGITVNGQKYNIEIVTADDQSSPPGAVAAVSKLIQDGIKFVISPIFAPNDLAMGKDCEQAKVLRMCPNRGNAENFGPPDHYSFLAEETIFNCRYVYDRITTLYPHVKRIAIIHPDEPNVKGLADEAEKQIKQHGLQVVINEPYKIPTEDFYPTLVKVMAQKPDAIECLFALLPWSKGIIEQSRENGFTGPVFAVASLGDNNELKAMIDPNYAYDICHATPYLDSPKTLPIVREYGKVIERETREKFNMDHVMTFQALWAILQGIERAQSLDTDRVVAVLETAKNIQTPYGPGRFGGKELIGINRLMIRDVPFTQIMKGGKMEYEALTVKK